MSHRAHADGETNDMPRKMTGRDCAKLADFTTDMRQGVARLPEACAGMVFEGQEKKAALPRTSPWGLRMRRQGSLYKNTLKDSIIPWRSYDYLLVQSYAFFRLRAIACLRYFSSEKMVSRRRSRFRRAHCLSNIPTRAAATPFLSCVSGFPSVSEGRSCSLRGPLRAGVKAFLANAPRFFRFLYKNVSASIRTVLKTSSKKPLFRHSGKGGAGGGAEEM